MDTITDPGTTWRIDEAIEACHVEHAPGLERYVRSLVRDPDDAADICQEAFVRLFLAAREGALPDSPGAWLRRVAHNLAISSHRHRQVGDRVLVRLGAEETSPSIEDTAIRHETNDEIVAALGLVSADDRTAIVLAAQGYRTREIASRLGRTELASRALLCRARSRLGAAVAVAQAS